MKNHFIVLFILSLCMGELSAQAIIPQPTKLIAGTGANFILDEHTVMSVDDPTSNEAKIITELMGDITGIQIPIVVNSEKGIAPNTIRLNKRPELTGKEGYLLSSSSEGITISASYSEGIFYGGMTLLQLLEENGDGTYSFAPLDIEDEPRFGWRGLMLDCSRTFISPRYLKETIDRLSFYKLNVLHLHLTDDQGWRLEIEQRPKLTTEGAYFAEEYHEPSNFEGYYSQEDIRELLEYAEKRHVEIIPEIEVPGHSSAPIHAYPDLSCSGRKVPIAPFFARLPQPPNDVFCAGNEETYTFFEEVLSEVTRLFPSQYVHLGGDEVPKRHWKECSKCQNKIQELALANEEHLQRHMMARVSKTIIDAGKRPIGWDEILDGEAEKDWIVMAWRDAEIGHKAVKAGYDVVLSPTFFLYFDYNHRTTPTKKVYSFIPIPEGTTAEEEARYMGIQANFWSHIDRTETRIDNMIYPRALALAERAWSRDEVRDYEDFENRKIKHLEWLKFFKVQYNGNDNPKPGNPWDDVWGGT